MWSLTKSLNNRRNVVGIEVLVPSFDDVEGFEGISTRGAKEMVQVIPLQLEFIKSAVTRQH